MHTSPLGIGPCNLLLHCSHAKLLLQALLPPSELLLVAMQPHSPIALPSPCRAAAAPHILPLAPVHHRPRAALPAPPTPHPASRGLHKAPAPMRLILTAVFHRPRVPQPRFHKTTIYRLVTCGPPQLLHECTAAYGCPTFPPFQPPSPPAFITFLGTLGDTGNPPAPGPRAWPRTAASAPRRP